MNFQLYQEPSQLCDSVTPENPCPLDAIFALQAGKPKEQRRLYAPPINESEQRFVCAVQKLKISTNMRALAHAARDFFFLLQCQQILVAQAQPLTRETFETVFVTQPDTEDSPHLHPGLGTNNPANRACHVTTKFFTWDTLPQLLTLSRDEQEYIRIALSSGIKNGLTVPFSLTGKPTTAVHFIFAEQNLISPTQEMAALTAAHHIYEAIDRIQQATRAPSTHGLNKQQIEIVRAMAQGVSSERLPEKLGLGLQALNDLIGDAMVKLKAQSREHAVFKAIQGGLITEKEYLVKA